MSKDKFKYTSIHTRVNERYRISSIFREYNNDYFSSWAWETYVWERKNDAEKIYYEADSLIEINSVMQLHEELYHKINNNLSLEEEE